MLHVKVDKNDPHRPVRAGCGRNSAVLGVNTNTVLRSLRRLRDEGLLEFRRGRGISVAGTPERGAVVQGAKELVDFARSQGYRVDELVTIIEDVG
jgi:GntR family transcriptional regulator